jgi:hypothetical protein
MAYRRTVIATVRFRIRSLRSNLASFPDAWDEAAVWNFPNLSGQECGRARSPVLGCPQP